MIYTFMSQIKNINRATAVLVCLVFFGVFTKDISLHAESGAPDMGEIRRAKPPLIFIYLQGYNSCRRIEDRPVRLFLNAAANNPNSKLYWGCFDGGHITHLNDTKEYFYLTHMNTKGEWAPMEEVEPQSGSLQIASYIFKDIKQFNSRYSSEKTPPKTNVFIAGHSHGGWMAMRVAYQMSLIENVKLQQLLTIDPISYKLCASHWFPFHILYNTFNWLGEPDNCHKAPAELDHIIPQIANAADGHWINIYQESMPYLTSGPMDAADQNIRYEPPTNIDWVNAHRAIMHTDWTWEFFQNRLAEILGLPTKPMQDRPMFNDISKN
jgi:hypothetical protein